MLALDLPGPRTDGIACRGRSSDRSLTHLVGLNFSRSWSLNHIAEVARTAERRGRVLKVGTADQLEAMANEHLAAALPLAVSGGWMGDHWLHTFALVASQSRTHNALRGQQQLQPNVCRI